MSTYGISQTAGTSGVAFDNSGAATIVANTTSETSLFTLMSDVSAGFWTLGKQVRIRIRGKISNTGTPTLTVKAYWNSTLIATTIAVPTPSTLANDSFTIELDVQCKVAGASGTLETCMDIRGYSTASLGWGDGVNTTTAALDVTPTGGFDVKVIWSAASASNTITASLTSIEVLDAP